MNVDKESLPPMDNPMPCRIGMVFQALAVFKFIIIPKAASGGICHGVAP